MAVIVGPAQIGLRLLNSKPFHESQGRSEGHTLRIPVVFLGILNLNIKNLSFNCSPSDPIYVTS
jgi:hypothetical protein